MPRPLAGIAGGLSTAALLLVPVYSAARRLLSPSPDRRRTLQHVSDGLLAAVLAYGLSLALDLWVDGVAPASLVAALTQALPGAGLAHTEPVYGYLAPVLAFLIASDARERRVPRTALAVSGLAGLAAGYATPTALLLGLLIGVAAANGTRYAVGTPDPGRGPPSCCAPCGRRACARSPPARPGRTATWSARRPGAPTWTSSCSTGRPSPPPSSSAPGAGCGCAPPRTPGRCARCAPGWSTRPWSPTRPSPPASAPAGSRPPPSSAATPRWSPTSTCPAAPWTGSPTRS